MAESEEEVNSEAPAEEEEPKFYYCEACGKRMIKIEDHGGTKLENTWCNECSDDSGKHKTKEQVKEKIVKWIMSDIGYKVTGEKIESKEEAEKMADEFMKNLPAWGGAKE
jgi:hypothetical protein